MAYAPALLAQGALAALFFIGACRRYRGAYLTTFNVAMGEGLLAVWGVLSIVAIIIWPNLPNGLAREFDQPSQGMQIVAAVCVAAVLALVPVHALVTWETRHAVTAGKRWLVIGVTVLMAGLAILASEFDAQKWGITLLVLGAHAVIVYGVMRIYRRSTPLVMGIAVVLLGFILWLVPLFLEMVRWYFQGTEQNNFSVISTFSPLGLLVVTWQETPEPMAWVGMIFLWAVAALLIRIGHRTVRARKVAVTVPPPQSAPS
jgi:hypothetical protein